MILGWELGRGVWCGGQWVIVGLSEVECCVVVACGL